ncbi:MAG: glycosyltransferase family 4 protein [Synechococcaceae cyanobacterium]|nr:glycosyltransferase family 4 protein [Synechococcaceae cyanobacterium]
MNILFLTYSYLPNLGGVERSVHNLARLLSGRGHAVTVVTHGGSAVPFHYRSAALPPVLRLHIPSQTDPRRRVRALRPVLNALNLSVLAGFCLLHRIDVIHAHLLNMDTLYGSWLARLLGIRFVLTLRGGETEEWIHNKARFRYVVNRLEEADFITAVSRSLLDQAAVLVPQILDRSAVIPNPVDPEALQKLAGTSAVIPQSRPYLLFAGRLEEMKDVACLLDAYTLRIAADPGFPADLVIAGEGSLRQSLQRHALVGAAASRIRFLGRLSQADTLRWIRSALALVLPSRCSEGCPNVLLEAMALKTPVLVSNLPSLREWVEDGSSGLVFPVGRPDALAARLHDLVAHPRARERWAETAASRLQTHFAMASIASAYEVIYASLPERRAARGSSPHS